MNSTYKILFFIFLVIIMTFFISGYKNPDIRHYRIAELQAIRINDPFSITVTPTATITTHELTPVLPNNQEMKAETTPNNFILSSIGDLNNKSLLIKTRGFIDDPHVFCYAFFNPYLEGNRQRITAYDGIRNDFSIYIRDTQKYRIESDVKEYKSEVFIGEMPIELEPGRMVSIPSVSPDAIIHQYHTSPRVTLEFYKDGCDNYYVSSNYAGRIYLIYTTSTSNNYYRLDVPSHLTLADIPSNIQPEVPENVRQIAISFSRNLGIENERNLRRIITVLIQYFSSFGCGTIPSYTEEPNNYLAIAKSRQGACRERSYAFFVTAISLGVPTRHIENECHAFVEVFIPGEGWKAINLGGCGSYTLLNKENKEPYDFPNSSLLTETPNVLETTSIIPTPTTNGTPLPTSVTSPPTEIIPTTTLPDIDTDEDEGHISPTDWGFSLFWPILLFLAIICLLFVLYQKGVIGIMSMIHRSKDKEQSIGASLDPRQFIFITYQEMLNLLGQIGFHKNLSETPYEFAKKVIIDDMNDSEVLNITQHFVVARYSERTVTEEDRSIVQRLMKSLMKKIEKMRSIWQKIRNTRLLG